MNTELKTEIRNLRDAAGGDGLWGVVALCNMALLDGRARDIEACKNLLGKLGVPSGSAEVS